MVTKANIDPTDLKILCVLQTQARISNKSLAEKVNLSPSACTERVNRLASHGFIREHQTIINLSKVCSNVVVFASAKLHDHRQEHFRAFADAAIAIPEVVECHMVSGHFDFILRLVCADMDRYVSLCNQLLEAGPGNIELVSHVVLEVTKPFRGFPLNDLVAR